jgi:chromosome partitioning protein
MPVIAIVNRKGGSGKSTLAVHLATHIARQGTPVVIGDVDRQHSAQTWVRLRRERVLPQHAAMSVWAVDPRNMVRPPAGVRHVVLDTPGGLRGFDLARVIMYADAILMPVCNSVFDRESSAECLEELRQLPRVASGRCRIAALGMRLDARTRAAETVRAWAEGQDLTFLSVLRETQTYVRCIEQGLTLFDLPRRDVQHDLAQWDPILEWIEPVLQAEDAPRTVNPSTVNPLAAKVRPVIETSAVARDEAAAVALANIRNTTPSRGVGARLGSLLESLPIPRFLMRGTATTPLDA